MDTPGPVAHIRPASAEPPHDLHAHLHATAALARRFAEPFGAGDWAELLGLWHDLGKYQLAFQQRMAALKDPEAHLEQHPGKVPHAAAGALHAEARFSAGRAERQLAQAIAALISAHHTGLKDWEGGTNATLANRTPYEATLAATPPAALLAAAAPSSRPRGDDPALWMRLLFSCLVDADFLDTDGYMTPEHAPLRTQWPPLASLAPRLDTYLARLAAKAKAEAPDSTVNPLRARVLAACREGAALAPGLFSLTVPTGGGKTLASLTFALHHALNPAHGKRRVIYVIPYTSIIEQTADTFREALGREAVLEHHSSLDLRHETPQSRLAAENWDAPVVVTTSVQFFESLFAARTSQVRKLHNIVNSVVVLDEAQLLPVDLLRPILGAMGGLSRHFGVSFLFCTATQPALAGMAACRGVGFVAEAVRELAPDPAQLHQALRRVQLTLPADLSTPRAWDDLAAELATHPSVLCIVNRRADARLLAELLPAGTFHLSALMCGQHRSDRIAEIKARLAAGEPVRVVSTQLVEAGVDLDFPVVYRALAGLDSIAQAAGRCNREGRLPGLGQVVVFVPPTAPPPGVLRQACDAGRQLLKAEDPLAPAQFGRFFQQLYRRRGPLTDKHMICDALKPEDFPHFNFATAAAHFKLIDSSYLPVLVRYGNGAGIIDQLHQHGPDRGLLRRAQRYVVNLPEKSVQALVRDGVLLELSGQGVFVQYQAGAYSERFGFSAEAGDRLKDDELII